MTPTFRVNRHDSKIIGEIAKRAAFLFARYDIPTTKMSIMMDVTATHANGNPLRLDALLEADDFNFAHDIFGITKHLDRDTGKLTDCFRPRFSVSRSVHGLPGAPVTAQARRARAS